MGELEDQLKGPHMWQQFFENFLYIGLQPDKHYSHSDNISILETPLTVES